MSNPILWAIPVFLLLIFVEYRVGKRRGRQLYRLHDTLTNLSIGIGNQAVGLFFKALLLGVYFWLYQRFGLFKEALAPSWWSVLLCLVLFDGAYYWAHRWSHEWNFLWGAHVVHHQSEEYNLSVALRQSWFHSVLAFFIFLPLPILGFDPLVFFGVGAVVTLYQFWIHTKAIDRMPAWFEFVFNSPTHHRVHHAIDPKYIDKNHAAIFILWDRIFGTFKEEEEEPTYGITTPLNSRNPFWANVHYYLEMWDLIKKAPRWRDKWRVLFARPGWRPEALGGYQAPQAVDKDRHQKYETEADHQLEIYAIFQFLAVLLGLLVFMMNYYRLDWGYRFSFLVIIVLSIVICGAILEQKRWVNHLEYLRLGFILISLNSLYYFQFFDWFTIMISCSMALTLLSGWYFSRSWAKVGLK